MPYRAILWTLVTTAVALLATGMWVRAVAPIMRESAAATQRAPAAVKPTTGPASTQRTPDESLHVIVNRTSLLAFMLITILLIVGLFATLREWLRHYAFLRPARTPRKTHYVDAWKLSAERMKSEGPEEQPPHEMPPTG